MFDASPVKIRHSRLKLFSDMTCGGTLENGVWTFLSHKHNSAGGSLLRRVHNSNKLNTGVGSYHHKLSWHLPRCLLRVSHLFFISCFILWWAPPDFIPKFVILNITSLAEVKINRGGFLCDLIIHSDGQKSFGGSVHGEMINHEIMTGTAPVTLLFFATFIQVLTSGVLQRRLDGGGFTFIRDALWSSVCNPGHWPTGQLSFHSFWLGRIKSGTMED